MYLFSIVSLQYTYDVKVKMNEGKFSIRIIILKFPRKE